MLYIIAFGSGLLFASGQLLIVTIAVAIFLVWQIPQKKYIIFLAIFFMLGYWRFNLSEQRIAREKQLTQKYYNQVIMEQGIVCKEPERTIKSQRIIICFKDLKVLATLPLYPEYDYGEVLMFNAKITAPENFSPDFDYQKYLAGKGIYATAFYPKLEKISQVHNFQSYLYEYRDKIRRSVNRFLPEPEASLSLAMMLGIKGMEEKDDFASAGLSHLIAISGSHISLLVMLFTNFLLMLGINKKHIFAPLLLFLFTYVALTGFLATAVRALIMGAASTFALIKGRDYNAELFLWLAFFVMTMINPQLSFTDVGFQLSFVSVWGLIKMYPLFPSKYKTNNFLAAGIMSVCAFLFTFPICAKVFGYISATSILSNMALFWIFAPLLSMSMIALPLANSYLWFWPYILLRIFEYGAKLFALGGRARIPINDIPIWLILGYYLGLMIVISIWKYKTKNGPH